MQAKWSWECGIGKWEGLTGGKGMQAKWDMGIGTHRAGARWNRQQPPAWAETDWARLANAKVQGKVGRTHVSIAVNP